MKGRTEKRSSVIRGSAAGARERSAIAPHLLGFLGAVDLFILGNK